MGVELGVEVQVNQDLDRLDGLSPSAWFRPEELMEDYGAGAEGATISLWRDASGNGRNLVGGSAPAFYRRQDNEGWFFPCAVFNGTNDYLNSAYSASVLFGTNGVGTVFVVGKPGASNAGHFWVQYRTDGRGMLAGSSIVARNYDGSGDTDSISLDSRGQKGIWVWMHDTVTAKVYAGCSLDSTRGGADITSGGTTTGALSGTQGLVVGLSDAGYYTGIISELIFFNTALTLAQRRQVMKYLRRKYSIPDEEDYTGKTWVALADVVAKHGIQAKYGMGGTSVHDRVADTGQMTFVLDNSEKNSVSTVGYYSPENPNSPSWWDIGTEVRLAITNDGTTYYKWRGFVESVDIVPSVTGIKQVTVSCVDWMDIAARTRVTGIPILQNKRSDEVFEELMVRTIPPPPARAPGYGQDTYDYALDNSEEESVALMTEFQRLANSELGYIYLKGDTNLGGTLVFESRLKRSTKTSALFALDKDRLIGMETTYAREDIINEALVQIFPRRVDTAATSVVFSLQSKPAIPRSTSQTFFGPFRDPSSGRFVRVGGLDMVTPVATTDYTLNSLEDGTGTDLTSQLTVVATWSSSGVNLTVTNAGPLDGYLTKMQVRGKGVYSDESVVFTAEDATSQQRFGKRTTRFDMPYQSDPSIGLDAAYFILNNGKNAESRLRSVTFLANADDTQAIAALAREISDKVSVAENVTWGAVTSVDVVKEYFINSIELNISPGKMLRCTWQLAPADSQAYWSLQSTGFTELGDTTILSYGLFTPAWQLDVSQLGVDTIINA